MHRTLLAALLLMSTATPILAQRELPPGVSLATRYTKLGRPILSVRPFAAAPAVQPFADQISGIIRNDLLLSDRFEMFTAPQTLATNGAVEYAQWNSLNVVWLVTGDVTATVTGYDVALSVHDVVYGNVKQARTFSLPLATASDFRMAVHALSDEVVRWITNQPGMAATRVVFARQNGNGSYDLMITDADGEDMRRIFGSPSPIYSPVWSADGSKIAYTRDGGNGSWELVERAMASGATRVVASGGLITTPAYSADGKLVFSMWVDAGRAAGLELHDWDGSRVRRLTTTSGDNMSPSFSGDGRRIAFHSSRTGRHHIYVMPATGGDALLLSPLGDRAEYYAPDWSPVGNQVAFHGQSREFFHLMLADASRPGSQITQLTSSGRNEDPSWAADGRHIVFTGVGSRGSGLYVIDVVTGEIRHLAEAARGTKLRMADWSPPLAQARPASQP